MHRNSTLIELLVKICSYTEKLVRLCQALVQKNNGKIEQKD